MSKMSMAFLMSWQWLVTAACMLAACCGLAVWYSFVPVYEATCILEANREFASAQAVDNEATRELTKGERQIIGHAIVLEPVLANPELNSAFSDKDPLQPAREIRKNLKIENAGTLLTISYQHNNPAMAARVCNAIAESYLQFRRQQDDERMASVEDWMGGAIDTWKRHVESLRDNLSELARAGNGFDPSKQGKSIAQLGDDGDDNTVLFFAKEDYTQAKGILLQLNERLAVLKSERGRGARVVTLATAANPILPIEEIPLRRIGLASMAGFFLPFASALLIRFRPKRAAAALR